MSDRSLTISQKEGMTLYISLYDLGLFILFILTVVVCAYLIAVLHRTFCVLGYARDILRAHHTDICEMLSVLPKAMTSVSELADSLKHTVDQAGSAFVVLQDDISDTVDDLRDSLQTFAVYGKVIYDLFRMIFSKS